MNEISSAVCIFTDLSVLLVSRKNVKIKNYKRMFLDNSAHVSKLTRTTLYSYISCKQMTNTEKQQHKCRFYNNYKPLKQHY